MGIPEIELRARANTAQFRLIAITYASNVVLCPVQWDADGRLTHNEQKYAIKYFND